MANSPNGLEIVGYAGMLADIMCEGGSLIGKDDLRATLSSYADNLYDQMEILSQAINRAQRWKADSSIIQTASTLYQDLKQEYGWNKGD
jgi:hypothetical protein